ncbi:MAG: NTP transferase domain-containing protein [Candidatus Aenigmarchaeota archaeon]|nr:NTP transferase domain-containing protein [Candidatus Aenigmarchaeota archaeon]
MKTIILAAGNGTRLKPFTETMSKPMIPIANKPLLEWIIEAVEVCSEEIFIVVRKEQLDIIDYFKNFQKITFVYQSEPLGTADAIGCCESYLKDYEGPILKLGGDDLISLEDINRISRLSGYYVGGFISDYPERFGVIETEDGFVVNIEEKPKNPKSNLVSCGLYMFDRKIFEYIKKVKLSERGEFELNDAIEMLSKKEKFKVFEVKKWTTITHPWELLEANKLILDQIGTQIGKNVEIRPGTYIEYPVAIGDGSVLGPNCFIRRYSTIGKNCKIGNAVEIKNSIIMDHSYVSHLSYIGDSIIGKDCNIGAGAIFANLRLDNGNIFVNINDNKLDTECRKLGAFIGDNVKIAVSVTIMPGKKIWPNIKIPPCSMITKDIKEQPDLKNYESTRKRL